MPHHGLSGSFPYLGFNQAKSGTARFIEPVGQKLDRILFLNSKVLVMCLRYAGFGCALHVVAIHVKRHIDSIPTDWKTD